MTKRYNDVDLTWLKRLPEGGAIIDKFVREAEQTDAEIERLTAALAKAKAARKGLARRAEREISNHWSADEIARAKE